MDSIKENNLVVVQLKCKGLSPRFSLPNTVNFQFILYLRRSFFCEDLVRIKINLMDILLNLRTFLFFLIFYRILNSVVKIVDREHTKPAIFPADYQQIFDYIEISHRGNMLFSWILDNVVVV